MQKEVVRYQQEQLNEVWPAAEPHLVVQGDNGTYGIQCGCGCEGLFPAACIELRGPNPCCYLNIEPFLTHLCQDKGMRPVRTFFTTTFKATLSAKSY